MTEQSQKPGFRLSPGRYGIVSLIAACLVFVIWPLILVGGLFVVLCLEVPLVLIAVVSGLVGLATGASYKDGIGFAAAILGLALIGFGVWSFSDAMNF